MSSARIIGIGKLRRGPSISVVSAQRRLEGPKQQCLVVFRRQLAVSALRSSLHDSPGAFCAQEAHHITTPTIPKRPARPTASWLTTRGADLDLDKVLNQLPRLNPDKNPKEVKSLTTALFLVTPQLAHLFEPGHNFHAAAIRRIFQPLEPGVQRRSIVAVVDALPVISEGLGPPTPDIHGCEGVALCVSTHFDTTVAGTKHDDSIPLITLMSSNYKTDNENKRQLFLKYTAPVANTLFVNGRRHTMFEQSWLSLDKESYAEEANGRRHLSGLEIPIYSTRDKAHPKRAPAVMSANLIRLTKPAAIVTSMGNIIRQIKTQDGKTMAASHELERLIPPLVKNKQEEYPNMELRVFALIYPPKLDEGADKPFTEKVFTLIGGSDPGMSRRNLQRMLLRGGRLYRVTSGGAGWGNKGGLLSLEPRTELDSRGDYVDDVEPSFDFHAESIRMPGSADLFPPGYIVQFVASWHDRSGALKDALTIADLPRHTQWLHKQYFQGHEMQKFCIGTTTVPELAEEQPRYTQTERQVLQIFCPNRFGFLTASAMSLSVGSVPENPKLGEQESIHSTLVEVPNSSILAVWPASDMNRLSENVVRGHFQDTVPSPHKVGTSLTNGHRISKNPLHLQYQTLYGGRKKAVQAIRMKVKQAQDKNANAGSLQRPTIRRVQARFEHSWERVRSRVDKNSGNVDQNPTPMRKLEVDTTTRTRYRYRKLIRSVRVGKERPENMKPTKYKKPRMSERRRLMANKGASTTQWKDAYRTYHGSFRKPQRLLFTKVGKLLIPKRLPSPAQELSFRERVPQKTLTRMPKVTSTFQMLQKGTMVQAVRKLFAGKATIRRMSSDDQRIASRMPGSTKDKDQMEGLIRHISNDVVPGELEQDKDFRSLFYYTRTSKEDEAVDHLLNDLGPLTGSGDSQDQNLEQDVTQEVPCPRKSLNNDESKKVGPMVSSAQDFFKQFQQLRKQDSGTKSSAPGLIIDSEKRRDNLEDGVEPEQASTLISKRRR